VDGRKRYPRSAWMFVGASIDTYLHERVRGSLLTKPMSKKARAYTVPLGPIEDMVDRMLRNRVTRRPRVDLKSIV
jgi:hypothetical protein